MKRIYVLSKFEIIKEKRKILGKLLTSDNKNLFNIGMYAKKKKGKKSNVLGASWTVSTWRPTSYPVTSLATSLPGRNWVREHVWGSESRRGWH